MAEALPAQRSTVVDDLDSGAARAAARVAAGDTKDGLWVAGRRCGPFTPEEEREHIENVARGLLKGAIDLDTVMLYSNCRTLGDVIAIANKDMVEDPATDTSFGQIIPEGHMGFVIKNGVTTMVGPGRWRLWSPFASWVDHMAPVKLRAEHPHIHCGPIHVIRVPAGCFAKVLMKNEPVLLSSDNGGLFCYNDPTFRFIEFVPVGADHIQHTTLNVLRISQGYYGMAEMDQRPFFLPMGMYAFKSDTFKFSGCGRMTDKVIAHDTISRFYVPKGCIAKVWQDSMPMFVEERGVYLVESPMFHFDSIVDIEEPFIAHGSKKIITVKEGFVGVSHKRGVLTVLQPGRLTIAEEGWHFDEFLSTQQQCLALTKDDDAGAPPTVPGQRGVPPTPSSVMVCETRELVRVGIQASVFYHIQNPKLAVVKIGERKMIEKFINETATAVITTIIRSTSLAEISQSGKDVKAPGDAGHGQRDQRRRRPPAQKFGVPDADEPSASASGVAGDSDEDDAPAPKKQDAKDDDDGDYSPNLPFFDRMHKDFVDRLQKNFLSEYGIFMLNMRISDFNVIDQDIAQSIANHAKTMAQTQAKLANLEGNRKIDLVNKDSDARIERIQAEVEAHKVTVRAKADNDAFLEKTRAKAEAAIVEANTNVRNKEADAKVQEIDAHTRALTLATSTKAEAEARKENALAAAEAMKTEAEAKAAAIRMIAEAEAAAIRVKAEAEAERARRLGEVSFGREVTMAEIHADMVKGSMGGVEKVVYLPTDMQKNPFALFAGSANNLAAGAAMNGSH